METFQFLHCITLLDNVAIPCNNRLWHYFFATKLSLSKWIDNLLSKNYLQMLVYVISIKLSNISHCVRSVQTRSFSGPYFPVFSPNMGKYGPEKHRIWTLFTQRRCYRESPILEKFLQASWIANFCFWYCLKTIQKNPKKSIFQKVFFSKSNYSQ